jgi:SAM-dependent methyltransferase
VAGPPEDPGTHRGTGSGTPHALAAAEWDERYAVTGLVWSAEPNQFVAQECAPLAPGTALDLGCGEGRNAIWLAGRGWRVTGVDFSAVALGKAEVLAAQQGVSVRWVLGDVLAELPVGAVDLVLLAYLHLPVQGRRRLLSGAAERVAPGGSLLLVGHDLRNLEDGTGGPREPSVLWTPGEVDVAGWQVLRRQTVARQVGDARAWDTLVHLRRPTGSAMSARGVQ